MRELNTLFFLLCLESLKTLGDVILSLKKHQTGIISRTLRSIASFHDFKTSFSLYVHFVIMFCLFCFLSGSVSVILFFIRVVRMTFGTDVWCVCGLGLWESPLMCVLLLMLPWWQDCLIILSLLLFMYVFFVVVELRADTTARYITLY